jgi:hypothetical protein
MSDEVKNEILVSKYGSGARAPAAAKFGEGARSLDQIKDATEKARENTAGTESLKLTQ